MKNAAVTYETSLHNAGSRCLRSGSATAYLRSDFDESRTARHARCGGSHYRPPGGSANGAGHRRPHAAVGR